MLSTYFFIPHLDAQVPAGINMASIDIDALSDEQFLQFINRAQLSGLSESALEAKALERGLTSNQINSIRQRYALLNKQGATKQTDPTYAKRESVSTVTPTQPTPVSGGLRLFGQELFSNTNLTFEPNMRMATPRNYILGPDDELVIDVFGYSERTYKMRINAEGEVRFPNIGPVRVASLSIDEANAKIRSALTTLYPAIKTGTTTVQVSLGQIRTIRVMMIGEVARPGTYSLSSLSTIANALYVSGGPSANGSFRSIQLIRNGKTIVHFDLYDFLLRGDLRKNLLLQDDDIIKVNTYQIRVSISGAVKRPAVFECAGGECILDIVKEFAGGFADDADLETVTVRRIGKKGREIIDVPYDSLHTFRLRSSDELSVRVLPQRFQNRVQIVGAVFYPGEYSVDKYPTLRDLLSRAELKENAFLNRALIRRLLPDHEAILENFSIADVLSGRWNKILQKNDSIYVFLKAELRENYTISVVGEVNKPGQFPFTEQMVLKDAILLAGGFKDNSSLRQVEIARRIRKDETLADTSVLTLIKRIDLTDSLNVTANKDFILEPFDQITVKRLPRNRYAGTVTIKGEVLFPGQYTLTNQQESISAVVSRAGGSLTTADLESAILLRKTFPSGMDPNLKSLRKNLVLKEVGDSLAKSNLMRVIDTSLQIVASDIATAVSRPGSSADIVLQDGDIIDVPARNNMIQVFGAVHLPKKMVYASGFSLRKAIAEAGGFTENAKKKEVYVVYPNGKVAATSQFLFFRNYPSLRPGAEIYVPEKKRTRTLSTGEIIGLTSGIVGMTTMILAIINVTR
jgi:protein involved in polysaccharide export with SLBB domain